MLGIIIEEPDGQQTSGDTASKGPDGSANRPAPGKQKLEHKNASTTSLENSRGRSITQHTEKTAKQDDYLTLAHAIEPSRTTGDGSMQSRERHTKREHQDTGPTQPRGTMPHGNAGSKPRPWSGPIGTTTQRHRAPLPGQSKTLSVEDFGRTLEAIRMEEAEDWNRRHSNSQLQRRFPRSKSTSDRLSGPEKQASTEDISLWTKPNTKIASETSIGPRYSNDANEAGAASSSGSITVEEAPYTGMESNGLIEAAERLQIAEDELKETASFMRDLRSQMSSEERLDKMDLLTRQKREFVVSEVDRNLARIESCRDTLAEERKLVKLEMVRQMKAKRRARLREAGGGGDGESVADTSSTRGD